MNDLFTTETSARAADIVAALLFILALACLSKHETAKSGNIFGMVGIGVALLATIVLTIDGDIDGTDLALLGGAMALGAAIGIYQARVVEMTGMPGLIALLNSFVGLAAVLVGWNGYLLVEADPEGEEAQRLDLIGTLGIHHAEVIIGIFIGAVTFTGSIVAFLKLSTRIKSQPLSLPGKNILNLGTLIAFAVLTVWFCIDPQLWSLIAVTLLALGLGWHLSPPSEVETCPSWSRCSTATRAGPPPHRASCWRTTFDHHRSPGRLLGCVSVLHHVPCNEPLLLVRDRRWLRFRSDQHE